MGDIQIDVLGKTILYELRSYSDEVADELDRCIKVIANETLADIKEHSPKKTGDYQKGWRVKIAHAGRGNMRTIIHNPTRYRLTHLLENDHVARNYASKNGGRVVTGTPHIHPAEVRANEKLMKLVERVVKRA